MPISTREAARRWGMSRATLQRHIASGKLSQSKDAAGNKGIDPAEMVRVYGEPGRIDTGSMRPPEAATDAAVSQVAHVAQLEAKLAGLTELLVEKDRRISDLQSAMHLLGHDRPKRPGWWPWSKKA